MLLHNCDFLLAVTSFSSQICFVNFCRKEPTFKYFWQDFEFFNICWITWSMQQLTCFFPSAQLQTTIHKNTMHIDSKYFKFMDKSFTSSSKNFRRFLPPCIPPGTSERGKMQDEVISSRAIYSRDGLGSTCRICTIKIMYLHTLFKRWALGNLEYSDAVQTSHSSACSWHPNWLSP